MPNTLHIARMAAAVLLLARLGQASAIEVEVKDLSPKFLAFYDAAVAEKAAPERRFQLSHEMTHAVHHALSGLSEGWERSIARTLFAEGLAMRVTESLRPGRGDAAYTEYRPGWLNEAAGKRRAILEGLCPHLNARDSATVMRFTMGTGTTGTEREAYYAGWLVVGHLLQKGKTFAELARIPEDQIPQIVEAALGEMLAGT
jgi:hypothetical protein